MTMFIAVLLLCVTLAQGSVLRETEEKCGYESCTQAKEGVLNVHIVPHTHDDVGWLKTVDQYYFGSRNNIQLAGVQYILDSVVKELWQDPKRRFMYVETAFFWKWWVRQSDDTKHKVHALVRQGRLQFVGGAWSMNDEAATHYQSTVDQFTWGLSKLNETFGPCGLPRVGWQIDPFGHSREFASVVAGMGYDGLLLGRIDFQDKARRLRSRSMETLWRGDDELGKPSDIFTGVLYNTYSPPPGFCFDVLCTDEPIIDDPDSPLYNVDSRVSTFLEYATNQSKHYLTNNVVVTMGGDFTYQDAAMWYQNLDKLIEYANLKAAKDGLKIKLFYSTPDCYLKAVKDAKPTLPTKQDDFFPYASDPTAFWTGYFTSRPTTKYFEREGNGYLQMVKQLQVLGGLEEHNRFVLNELKSAMGVMQHHDAITGTEKQAVTHDYERILHSAIEDAVIIARQAFNKFIQRDALKPPMFSFDRCRFNESSCHTSETSDTFVVTVYNPLAWNLKEAIKIPVLDGNYEVYAPNGEKIESQLIDIPEAVRNIPTRQSNATHEVAFIAYLHGLGVKSFYIKKVKKMKRDLNNKKRENDYYANINEYFKDIKEKSYIDIKNIEEFEKDVLEEKVPILNTDTEILENVQMLRDTENSRFGMLVKNMEVKKGRMEKSHYPVMSEEEMRMLSDEPAIVERFDDYLENEHIKVRIEKTTGEVTHVILPDRTLNMKVKMYYWTGCVGDNSNTTERSSGAYIFRPKTTTPIEIPYTHSDIIKGPVLQEARTTTDGNVFNTIRLYKGLNFLEHDFVVGPISIDDKVGKEYIVRYKSNVVNNGIFYTDSNGRQMLKRKLNERPQWNLTLEEPIAGNYYPVTNKIYIEDDQNRLAVLTDRAEGGTSLVEGDIELMLHRRLLHDDAFGVGEALNEVANGKGLVMRGRHRIMLSNPTDNNELLQERKQVLQFHLQPIVFVSSTTMEYKDWLTLNNCFVGIQTDLPLGVHLLTLEPWADKLLLRLENYMDRSANSTVEVDLTKIFNIITIKSFKETTLAANQWLDSYNKWTWETQNEFTESFNKAYDNFGEINTATDDVDVNDDGLKIKLKAKQIRTFIVDYEMTE
ncbi:lysosomal alpha-mannosidase-like [Epargyreus clarus]|uniref:lysosomal alpha-mannosidase-like n=1 Tax=Epargyreus clarus TaxID=520877 RepID=UPI003C2EEB7E